ESHSLLAHNANFEESFLKRYFDKVPQGNGRESYHDSLLYLALLFPEAEVLNLESFINHFGISDKEEHRGLADSRDLLKVLLISTFLTHQDKEFRMKLMEVLMEFPEDFFYRKFFALKSEELIEIAAAIDYPLEEEVKKYLLKREETKPGNLPKFDKFYREFSGQNIQNILRAEEDI